MMKKKRKKNDFPVSSKTMLIDIMAVADTQTSTYTYRNII